MTELPDRAVHGGGLHDVCADGAPSATTSFNNTGLSGLDDLPLPGAGHGCGEQPERVLEHRDGDDAGGAGHAGADGARAS